MARTEEERLISTLVSPSSSLSLQLTVSYLDVIEVEVLLAVSFPCKYDHMQQCTCTSRLCTCPSLGTHETPRNALHFYSDSAQGNRNQTEDCLRLSRGENCV